MPTASSILKASLLDRRATEAVQQRIEHVEGFHVLANALPTASVAKWTKMVMEWEHDPKKNPNPYSPSKTGTSEWNHVFEFHAYATGSGILVSSHR